MLDNIVHLFILKKGKIEKKNQNIKTKEACIKQTVLW